MNGISRLSEILMKGILIFSFGKQTKLCMAQSVSYLHVLWVMKSFCQTVNAEMNWLGIKNV